LKQIRETDCYEYGCMLSYTLAADGDYK